ncbi:MAG: hypothetical protein ACRDZN_08190 [Acidimicrobiales bacterium]
MKFKLGAAIGFAAGYVAGAKASQERRQQVDDTISRIRGNPRVQHVSEVVTRDAKRIGDALEHRLAESADHAAKTVAGTVEPSTDDDGDSGDSGDSGGGNPTGRSASGSSPTSAKSSVKH